MATGRRKFAEAEEESEKGLRLAQQVNLSTQRETKKQQSST